MITPRSFGLTAPRCISLPLCQRFFQSLGTVKMGAEKRKYIDAGQAYFLLQQVFPSGSRIRSVSPPTFDASSELWWDEEKFLRALATKMKVENIPERDAASAMQTFIEKCQDAIVDRMKEEELSYPVVMPDSPSGTSFSFWGYISILPAVQTTWRRCWITVGRRKLRVLHHLTYAEKMVIPFECVLRCRRYPWAPEAERAGPGIGHSTRGGQLPVFVQRNVVELLLSHDVAHPVRVRIGTDRWEDSERLLSRYAAVASSQPAEIQLLGEEYEYPDEDRSALEQEVYLCGSSLREAAVGLRLDLLPGAAAALCFTLVWCRLEATPTTSFERYRWCFLTGGVLFSRITSSGAQGGASGAKRITSSKEASQTRDVSAPLAGRRKTGVAKGKKQKWLIWDGSDILHACALSALPGKVSPVFQHKYPFVVHSRDGRGCFCFADTAVVRSQVLWELRRCRARCEIMSSGAEAGVPIPTPFSLSGLPRAVPGREDELRSCVL